jgi:hypothetical protein
LLIHLATLHIPQRHLRKRESWTIIGLFYVPLEFQPKMKNWIYHHSTGFLNYKVSLPTALYCWVCQMLSEISFQITATRPKHLRSHPVFSGVCVTRSLVLCVCFVDRFLSLCPFSFGHCVVCPSIYGFWLPLCYLKYLLKRLGTL